MAKQEAKQHLRIGSEVTIGNKQAKVTSFRNSMDGVIVTLQEIGSTRTFEIEGKHFENLI